MSEGNGAAAGPGGNSEMPKDRFVFTSEPDKAGRVISFLLRANSAGWQIEDFSYYGVTAFVEDTETVEMAER
jgi:hypothetical protein